MRTNITVAKQDRIGARVPHEVYATLRRAAELTSATVNQFWVQASLKEAQLVIEREQLIQLSPRDWNWLLGLMDDPPQPNDKQHSNVTTLPALMLQVQALTGNHDRQRSDCARQELNVWL